MSDRPWGFRTRALHAGGTPDPTTGARAVPIYQTTSFVFKDSADAASLFALQKYGNVYSRIGNPTVEAEHTTDAGLTVVMNRCVKIEHARFAGGLHLAGFNTGVVSSRRHANL